MDLSRFRTFAGSITNADFARVASLLLDAMGRGKNRSVTHPGCGAVIAPHRVLGILNDNADHRWIIAFTKLLSVNDFHTALVRSDFTSS